MMLELDIETKADRRAKENGFLVRKTKWIGRRGAPDKFYSRADTGPFFVEYKRPGQTLDPHQERELARLRAAGVTVHVIDNLDDALDLFA